VSGPPVDPARPDPIRVLIVDDHPLWRDAVERDLSAAGLLVVGTAADGAEALRRLPAVRPDVVVLDLQLPVMNGVETTRQIIATHAGVRVLILTASGEQADLLEAVKAGATGYLVKSVSREELVDAVRRTALGEAVFTSGLAGLVLGEFRRLAALPTRAGHFDGDGDTPRLTDRETQTLRLVAKGMSSRQIAERLEISHRTVQNHTQSVLSKLHLHNRVELARYAIEQGLDGAS
jgi:DNA-binding NarL/FixJ family response regulator